MGLVLFVVVLALVLWMIVHRARRAFGATTVGAPGVDYARPAPLRELIPALVHAGTLELAVACAAVLAVAVVILALRMLT